MKRDNGIQTDGESVSGADKSAGSAGGAAKQVGEEKLKAYLGFSVRSGKILLGADDIFAARRGVHLILADADLGKTAMKRLKAAAENSGAPMYLYSGKLGELLYKPAAKAAALKDKNLARAAEGAVRASEKWNLYSEGEI